GRAERTDSAVDVRASSYRPLMVSGLMTDAVDRARVFGERARAVERIAPGFFPDALEAEHIARYRWSAKWVRGARVLDIACGAGYGASLLRQSGALRVISLDRSLDALHFGQRRYLLKAICADAHRLPFGSNSYDSI